MAQVHVLNDTTINYIAQADWEDTQIDAALDGVTVHNRWRLHFWRTEAMTAAEFDTIYALEGQKVSITTVDYNDRTGDYKIYYGAELRSVEGEHAGPIVQNVNIEFWVRI